MAQMLRKQIYIEKRQQALLKRLAKKRGVSEAEIIRQAIDREAGGVENLAAEDLPLTPLFTMSELKAAAGQP